MVYRGIALVVILGSALLVLTAQQPASSGIFTSAQADAGRVAYERTCGKCHTSTLMGRKGDPGELPPLSSLSASYQKFIGPRGFVAPLAGKVFIDRWGPKTAAQLLYNLEYFASQTNAGLAGDASDRPQCYPQKRERDKCIMVTRVTT
jgi:hypothetical protein